MFIKHCKRARRGLELIIIIIIDDLNGEGEVRVLESSGKRPNRLNFVRELFILYSTSSYSLLSFDEKLKNNCKSFLVFRMMCHL